ncbi:MAG: fucose isomerase [Chloroflexi bacterium]|nr:fucose isomerase [Chloroflexota bacterium]
MSVVGLVAIVRTTFDVPLATEIAAQAREQLDAAGLTVISPTDGVTDLEAAQTAAADLAETPLDLLIVLQATFADTTMIMALADQIDASLALWAVPEAHTGERLRLNSMCGVNLAAHALTRSGRRYHAVYGAPDDQATLAQIEMLARAGAVRRRLQSTRIGRAGHPPAGFPTCDIDAADLKRTFGVDVVPIDLETTVFAEARSTDPAAVAAAVNDLQTRVSDLDSVDAEATQGTLSVYLTLKQIAEREDLDGLAVRCWPEFFTELGCAACGASSLLSDDLLPSTCEADVGSALTNLMLQWLSAVPAFDTDVVSLDTEHDALVLWHCGKAPLSMANPAPPPGVTIHSNRKRPLLMAFALKPGRVTVARISQATGSFRLVIGSGEIVEAPAPFSGTAGLLRFDRPAHEVLATILGEGLEHHLSITYGDHTSALLALAQMLNLPVLRL